MAQTRTALITGSTSGIGKEMAELFAENGYNVMLNGLGGAKEIESLRTDMAKQTGMKIAYHPANMLEPDEIADMITQTHKEFGSVDVLVNNAGIQFTGPIDGYPIEKWDAIIAINLSACFHATRAALPVMKKQRYGRIINIASVHGLVASKNKGAYVAAKHGLVGLTKVTALEEAANGITANAICPGWTKTPLAEKQVDARAEETGLSYDDAKKQLITEKQAYPDFVTTEQVGQLALFLASDAAKAITGSSYTIDGGWTAQ